MATAVTSAALSEMIGAIYDCAIDPALWPATLARISGALGFHNSTLALQEFPSGRLLLDVSTGIAPEWIARRAAYEADIPESWGGAERMLAAPVDEVYVNSIEVPGQPWKQGRYFREWVGPQGLEDVAGLIIARNGAMMAHLGFGRHRDKMPIRPEDVAALRLLLPHLQRSVAISKLLDVQTVAAASFAATLDSMATAVALVARDLRIVHANAAARALLEAGDPAEDADGFFAVARPAAAAALAEAVRRGADHEAGIGRRGFGIPAARKDGSPAVLHVLPLRHGALRPGLMPGAAVAVFIAAPAAAAADAPREALAALFDLSAAESRVFAAIAGGATRGETAAALGVGVPTVKTHLNRIFAKTGAKRTAGLVKLAASLSLAI